MRIAMWSGPRNLSTAMMYSFAARGDCAVWDEPFYASYLKSTGLDHPMATEIMAAGVCDPVQVAAMCRGPVPDGLPHYYLKLMTHHMLPDVPVDWLDGFVHVHLIRHPARVIASYSEKRENPSLNDLGYPQQQTLFRRFGGTVIDSDDVRRNPGAVLSKLCHAIGLDYTSGMLRWPVGGLPQDGVWARHWYNAVHHSTGFSGPDRELPDLDGAYAELMEQAEPIYQELRGHRLHTG